MKHKREDKKLDKKVNKAIAKSEAKSEAKTEDEPKVVVKSKKLSGKDKAALKSQKQHIKQLNKSV